MRRRLTIGRRRGNTAGRRTHRPGPLATNVNKELQRGTPAEDPQAGILHRRAEVRTNPIEEELVRRPDRQDIAVPVDPRALVRTTVRIDCLRPWRPMQQAKPTRCPYRPWSIPYHPVRAPSLTGWTDDLTRAQAGRLRYGPPFRTDPERRTGCATANAVFVPVRPTPAAACPGLRQRADDLPDAAQSQDGLTIRPTGIRKRPQSCRASIRVTRPPDFSVAGIAVKGLVAFVRPELKFLGAVAPDFAEILIVAGERATSFVNVPAPLPAWKNCSMAILPLA